MASTGLAVLAVAGCGGGGSSSESATESAAPAKAPAKAESTSGTSAESAGGKITPAGTHLKVGEMATVTWIPFAEEEPTAAQSGFEFEAEVEAIEEKTTGDLSGLELEPEEEEETPFFVKVKLTALSAAEPPAEEQPGLVFTAIDDRGQEKLPVTILEGGLSACEEVLMPANFSSGKSYSSCFLYLVRPGGSIASVQWNAGPHQPNAVTPYLEEPVVWEAK